MIAWLSLKWISPRYILLLTPVSTGNQVKIILHLNSPYDEVKNNFIVSIMRSQYLHISTLPVLLLVGFYEKETYKSYYYSYSISLLSHIKVLVTNMNQG